MKKSSLIVGGLYILVGAVFLVLAIYITAHTESKLGGVFSGLPVRESLQASEQSANTAIGAAQRGEKGFWKYKQRLKLNSVMN